LINHYGEEFQTLIDSTHAEEEKSSSILPHVRLTPNDRDHLKELFEHIEHEESLHHNPHKL
jgi:hypothetical protein